MTIPELEALVTGAGLHLISKWSPRFLVSLRVDKKFGCRRQAGKLEFESTEAFEAATTDEVTVAITELYDELLRASNRKQGVVKKTSVKVATNHVVTAPTTINYPAH